MNTIASTPPGALGPVLEQATFDKFRALIYEKTGIHMREGKQILIANRLRKRINTLNMTSYEQYYQYLSGPLHGDEMTQFIDAVSTNETYFYREAGHFEALVNTVLPQLFRAGKTTRIWSAGCSTGEEVYTLRIVTDEAARRAGVPAPEIVGTDISTAVIAKAQEGVYRERALRFLPPEALKEYFAPLGEGSHQVRPEARKRVRFAVHNLFQDPAPWDRVDVIFCRNVMIYFDKQTQARLVDEIFAPALVEDGFLFIGHSESLSGFTKRFAYAADLRAPIYRKKREATA
jgi:chemotaxis protein methyltransferase CheR